MKLAASAGAGALTATVLSLAAGTAQAAPTCSSLIPAGSTPVYITGSSAVSPLLQALANQFAQLSSPIAIIYQKPTSASCGGLVDVTTGVPDTTSGNYLTPSTTGLAKLTGCTTGSGVNVDIGVSDVYASTCNAVTLGANQYDYIGAISPMEFVVPNGSSYHVISYNAAYDVFRYGGLQAQVTPWTTLGDIFIRNPSSGTELVLAGAIGLPANQWLASAPDGGAPEQYTSATNLLSALQDVVSSEPDAIGILSASYVDPNKTPLVTGDGGVIESGGLQPLAFQAKGQSCGYYADSQESTFDKINVRQGRYAPWGPTHWVTNTVPSDGSTPTPVGVNGNSAAVATVIAWVTHAASLTSDQDAAEITVEAQNSFVPWCAMQVSRSAEVTVNGSGESSYLPPKGCGCFFEKQAGATQAAYCKSCGGPGDCSAPTPNCNYGYCEVQ